MAEKLSSLDDLIIFSDLQAFSSACNCNEKLAARLWHSLAYYGIETYRDLLEKTTYSGQTFGTSFINPSRQIRRREIISPDGNHLIMRGMGEKCWQLLYSYLNSRQFYLYEEGYLPLELLTVWVQERY